MQPSIYASITLHGNFTSHRGLEQPLPVLKGQVLPADQPRELGKRCFVGHVEAWQHADGQQPHAKGIQREDIGNMAWDQYELPHTHSLK